MPTLEINVMAFARKRPETYNFVFGRTVNSANRNLTSRGSSGGEGALMHLKGSPLGVGSDVGGKKWDEEAYALSEHGGGGKLYFAIMWDGRIIACLLVAAHIFLHRADAISVVDWEPLKYLELANAISAIWKAGSGDDLKATKAATGEPIICTMRFTKTRSRSVHGFAKSQSNSPGLASAFAVLFYGERDASSLGHAGAGKFWSDVWLLNKDAAAEDGEAGWAWQKVDVPAQDVADRAATPEGRGWFASTEVVDNGRSRVFMHGGLLSSNERSNELWELQIE
ncbi:hypothetical protein WOLCODRAFT_167850 [Wolfiporia cocos MD-104 SS10]|uniref:Amidase domain-containing protein n=1 Tax=Wolfiporia cocos (strain MD-104) TaxID=742152 RepID=A0A2H3JRB2_WOLCO|nr:hypothetical protein WOLCODRAFT_167850 [Wolfiporia cocos MD-104 SS10]